MIYSWVVDVHEMVDGMFHGGQNVHEMDNDLFQGGHKTTTPNEMKTI